MRAPLRSAGIGARWIVPIALCQIALAAFVVVAPKALFVMAGGAGLIGLLIWSFGSSPARRLLEAHRAEAGAGAGTASPGRPAPLPAVWNATLVTFALFVLDVQGIFTHGDSAVITPLRYLLLPVPFAVMALAVGNGAMTRKIRIADVMLGLLLVWGLTASLAYKLLASGEISGLSFFMPMLVALFHLLRRGGDVSEASARRMLDLLSYLGAAYVVIHLAAGLGVWGISRGAHGHQTAFVLALAVAAAYATGRRKLAQAELWAIAAIYLLYPAATYVTTTGAVLVTVLLLSKSRTGIRKVVIVSTGVAVLFLGFSSSLSSNQDSFANSILPKYFDALGKSDNSDFRREMLRLGVDQVKESPLIGGNFTKGFALPTRFRFYGAAVLPHNDFLELALAGGLLALGLFAGWAAATNVYVLRRHRQLVDAGAEERARLVWVLLLSFNACLAVGLFQPVLFEVGTVMLFFLFFSSLRVACEQPVDGEAAPADDPELVLAPTAPARLEGQV